MVESAPRKKKRGASLHAVAASSTTTETPPPTLLNAKQRKKKQIEVGSSESASDPSQVEPEPMEEDAGASVTVTECFATAVAWLVSEAGRFISTCPK